LCEADRLFLRELNKIIEQGTRAFDDYNYSRAKLEADGFFWKVFADNYLEIVKNRVYNGTAEEKASAFYTLYQAFLAIVKLMAPFTPYITEEIYQTHFRKNEGKRSVHLEDWPEKLKLTEKKNDDEVWKKLIEVITLVRQKKSEAKKSVKVPVEIVLEKKDFDLLNSVESDLRAVLNVQKISFGKEFNVGFV
jgi:valyl-tRNA synthetase